MRELNVNEIKDVNGGGAAEAACVAGFGALGTLGGFIVGGIAPGPIPIPPVAIPPCTLR